MRKVDRYLLGYFFRALLVIVIAVGFIIVIINMVEQLRYFIDNEVPLLTILEYYLYFAGWVLKSFFPVFVLLACLFAVSVLARKNEILAMKASGLSLYRIAAPFLITTLLLSAGHFYYSEYIYPPANQRRLEIREFTIKNQSKRRYEKIANVYRQIQPGHFYTLAVFNVLRNEGVDLKVYRSEGNKLRSVLTAASMIYEDSVWQAQNGTIRTFSDSLGQTFEQFAVYPLPEIAETPLDLGKRLGKPEDMGLEELREYIEIMKRSGGPYVREAIDLRLKYAYPLASFIVVLISVPFAANPRRGGVAVSFSVGALIALVYFVLFRILQSAGYNEKVPTDLAVWGVDGLFFVIGLVALITARK